MALDIGLDNQLFDHSRKEEVGMGSNPPTSKALTKRFKSIGPGNFHGEDPDVDNITQEGSFTRIDGGTVNLHAEINLPQGAEITAVIVTGTAATEDKTWELFASGFSGGSASVATAAINTESTTINPLRKFVDNEIRFLRFKINGLVPVERINAARITYLLEGKEFD